MITKFSNRSLAFVAGAVLSSAPVAAYAASYSLPSDIGNGPFSGCSGTGPVYTCSDNVNLNNNDSVTLTADVTLDINGGFVTRKDVLLDNNGFVFNIVTSGDIQVDDRGQINANLDAGGKIELGKNVVVNGALTAVGDIKIGDDVSIAGNIDSGGKIDIGKTVTVSGDVSAAGDVKIGDDVVFSGDISVGGKLDVGKRGTINGDLKAASDIKVNQDVVVNGDITSGGNLDIGNRSTVNGTCTPSHPQCSGGVPPGSQTCETFRDEFSAINYAAQNGTANWTASWNEQGDDGSPNGGNIRIRGGAVEFRGGGTAANALGGPYLEREANLLAYTSATLTFDYREAGGWEPSDSFEIYLSADGGASWILLQTFADDQGGAFQPFSADITPYIAFDTRIALVEKANANNEVFFLDNVQIEACGPAVDHFSVGHDGAAVNCQVEPIMISAHTDATAPHVVETAYAGTITLGVDSGHGDWSFISGGNPANLTNLGNGSATYSFDGSENGTVVLGLANTFAETIDIDVSDGTASETSGAADASDDPPLTFAPSGFRFLADGAANAIGTQIAGKASNQGHGAQVLELEAIDTNSVTGACEAALTGPVTIEIGFECEAPNTCQRPLFLDSVAPSSAIPGTDTDAANPLNYASVTLDFGDAADTTASLVLNYPDAGRIQLHARYALAPSGEDLVGGSNPFVVRPFGFHVAVPHPAPPHATDQNGNILSGAGTPFSVDVIAALWNGIDDDAGGSDGVPDNHDDNDPANNDSLAGNSVTLGGTGFSGVPNFGQAGADIELTALLFAPAGGNDPGLPPGTLITSFIAGAGSHGGVVFDEVGIIEIAAGIAGGDYLGIGPAETALMLSKSGHVGRFVPAGLVITSTADGQFAHANPNGAVPFTYVGQTFGYAAASLPSFVVSAQNAGGSVTRNYTGAWAKLDITGISLSAPVADASKMGKDGVTPMALNYAVNSGFTINDQGDGSHRIDFGLDDAFTYIKNGNSEVTPFAQDIDLVITEVRDGDNIATAAGATLQPAPPASPMPGTQVRFGRLRMENAFGSELGDLPMNYFFEYYDEFAGGTAFWSRLDDIDTTLSVALPDEIDEQAPNTAATAINPVIPGQYQINLSAPGAGNAGDYLITTLVDASGESWLQYDWDGGGLFDDNPSAIATFGIFEGDPVQIYIQQIYQ